VLSDDFMLDYIKFSYFTNLSIAEQNFFLNRAKSGEEFIEDWLMEIKDFVKFNEISKFGRIVSKEKFRKFYKIMKSTVIEYSSLPSYVFSFSKKERIDFVNLVCRTKKTEEAVCKAILNFMIERGGKNDGNQN
jgi:hypothetical protein